MIFLFEFKIGHKAAETTCNINNSFGLQTANEHTWQRWFKKFCKMNFEDEECDGWLSKAVLQFLSHVRLFATPWTTAHQASLSFTISWSLLKLMSIELMIGSWQWPTERIIKAKTRLWSMFGGLLLVCSITAFWILAKPLYLRSNAQQINEMPWKLQHLQLALVNKMGLILLQDNFRPHVVQPTLQKLKELGYKVLPHLSYSPDLLPTDYHFFKHLSNLL